MDFFFCLPIFFGCPTKIKPDGDPTARVCPRCHNAAVFSAKSRTWFELCFVPLVPMKTKHVWMCGICSWNVPLQPGWEPMVPQGGYMHPNTNVGPSSHNNIHAGYQPGYAPAYTGK